MSSPKFSPSQLAWLKKTFAMNDVEALAEQVFTWGDENGQLSGYATQEWVSTHAANLVQGAKADVLYAWWIGAYASLVTADWIAAQGYATEAWVQAQGFATPLWVQAQGYLTSAPVVRKFKLTVSDETDIVLPQAVAPGSAVMVWKNGVMLDEELLEYAFDGGMIIGPASMAPGDVFLVWYQA